MQQRFVRPVAVHLTRVNYTTLNNGQYRPGNWAVRRRALLESPAQSAQRMNVRGYGMLIAR